MARVLNSRISATRRIAILTVVAIFGSLFCIGGVMPTAVAQHTNTAENKTAKPSTHNKPKRKLLPHQQRLLDKIKKVNGLVAVELRAVLKEMNNTTRSSYAIQAANKKLNDIKGRQAVIKTANLLLGYDLRLHIQLKADAITQGDANSVRLILAKHTGWIETLLQTAGETPLNGYKLRSQIRGANVRLFQADMDRARKLLWPNKR